jgi:plastocyanin
MSKTTKLAGLVIFVAGLFTSVGLVPDEAGAAPAVKVQQASPTITITNEGITYSYSPAQLDARVGEAITIVNKDPRGVHSVTETNRLFRVDVSPNSSETLTVSEAGNYQYYCDWHSDSHEPKYGALNVS